MTTTHNYKEREDHLIVYLKPITIITTVARVNSLSFNILSVLEHGTEFRIPRTFINSVAGYGCDQR